MQAPGIPDWSPALWTQEEPLEGVAARAGYALCSLPRSGSTLLCDLLRSTGALGRPHEFLSAFTMRDWGVPGYPEEIDSQVNEIKRRGVSANGIYGFKLFPHQLARIGQTGWLRQLPGLRFVHLQRHDLLGSALSLVHAAQTNRYTTAGRVTGQAFYDRAAITDALDTLLGQHALLTRFFATAGIVPLNIAFDDLIADPQSQVDAVARLVGLESAAIDPDRLGVQKQAEPEKAEWRFRFLEEEAEREALVLPRSPARVRFDQRVRKLRAKAGLAR